MILKARSKTPSNTTIFWISCDQGAQARREGTEAWGSSEPPRRRSHVVRNLQGLRLRVSPVRVQSPKLLLTKRDREARSSLGVSTSGARGAYFCGSGEVDHEHQGLVADHLQHNTGKRGGWRSWSSLGKGREGEPKRVHFYNHCTGTCKTMFVTAMALSRNAGAAFPPPLFRCSASCP